MRIRWTDRADSDLSAIKAFIAKDSARSAKAMADKIVRRVDQLRTIPHLGAMVPEFDESELREILVGNYRVVYRVCVDQIRALAIVHAAQQMPSNLP